MWMSRVTDRWYIGMGSLLAANAPLGDPGTWVMHVLENAIGSIVIGKPFSWNDQTVLSMYFHHSHILSYSVLLPGTLMQFR